MIVKAGIVPGSRWMTVDKDNVRRHGYTYRIVSDDPNEPLLAVAAASPTMYSPSLFDPTALCISLKIAEQSEAGAQGSVWRVDAEWSTDAIERMENPLDEPVRYTLRWATYEKLIEKDIDGNSIVNTVGDVFFDPPYTEEDHRPILVATKNYPAEALEELIALALEYKNAINAEPYLGAPAETALLRPPQMSDLQVQNEIEYYTVTFEIEFNPDGWQPEILNRGHRAKRTDGSIYDIPNNNVLNLKEDGTLVEPNGQPYYIPFNTKHLKSFVPLGI